MPVCGGGQWDWGVGSQVSGAEWFMAGWLVAVQVASINLIIRHTGHSRHLITNKGEDGTLAHW